ncbi:GNAT family N-acetyltransferase [Paracoccus sp. SJTW-4]|uniref:GNAT family N-acetyltransferase n=1 Tax=Paracoccus sp. SJTW-4 TaxID=3078428 RepID=UPI0039EA6884
MERIEGPNLVLRLIQPEDAEYAHGLRTDPIYNAYLSFVTGTIADQRRWIEEYKSREAQGLEYYYVIERRVDGTRCGLVRLYDFDEDHFTWGSWILDANKPAKAALESAVLSFGTGFDILGMTHALIDVRHANTHAAAFYRRFGMKEITEDAQNIFFIYPRETFLRDRATHLAVLNGAAA